MGCGNERISQSSDLQGNVGSPSSNNTDPTPEASSAVELIQTEEPLLSTTDTAAIRTLAFAYWEALNLYDGEKALGYLEPNYRQKHKNEVESGIGQMKLFRVKLGVTEESPPSIVGPNKVAMYMTLKEPLGTRRILMEFATVGEQWKITFSEEVE